jgi:hypothetical protein
VRSANHGGDRDERAQGVPVRPSFPHFAAFCRAARNRKLSNFNEDRRLRVIPEAAHKPEVASSSPATAIQPKLCRNRGVIAWACVFFCAEIAKTVAQLWRATQVGDALKPKSTIHQRHFARNSTLGKGVTRNERNDVYATDYDPRCASSACYRQFSASAGRPHD